VVLLVPGFGLFLLVGWMLDKLTGRRRPAGRGGRISSRPAPGTVMPSPRGAAIAPRRMLIVVLCILLTSASALAATSRLLHLYFLKVPVPLPRPLTEIPADLGPWRQCGGNRAIAADIEESLGTNDYIFRDYVDERVVGAQAVEALGQNPSEAAGLVSKLAASHPGAVVRVAVTYYTGRVDAVIHQSERCNLAGGIATSIESEPATWDLGGRLLNVRTVHLIKDLPEGETSHYIAYCYCVNGREETEAWRVRGLLMNIFAREAWYAKIEVTTGVPDARESQRVLTDFLHHALPEIEAGLPPMQNVTATAPSPGKAGKTGT
jgi:hypothetical protein